MKYSKKIIIGLALCAGIVTSCKEDEAGVSNNISTDKDEITIGPEGGTEQVAVSTSADWVAGSAKPWISISPANGMGSADCRLAIDFTGWELPGKVHYTICSGRTRAQTDYGYPVRFQQADIVERTGSGN